MENTNVNVTNSAAEETEVKHMLQLAIGAKDLREILSQIKSVKAKAILFTPGELTSTTTDDGKVMTLCNYQISKVLEGGAVGIKTNATIRYRVYGFDGKAVAIKAEPEKDMRIALAADELESFAGIVSETDTLAFVVNTTDKTCTVKVVSSNNGGAFKAEVALPVVEKYLDFEVTGKELASATVMESDIKAIDRALSSICIDLPKDWMNSVALGFGGKKLKTLVTNSVMFMATEIENSEVTPCKSEEFFLIKKEDFAMAAGLVKAGGKVKISLRGKEAAEGENEEVTGFAFFVEGGPVATFAKFNINGGCIQPANYKMFAGMSKKQENEFVFDKDDIEKAFHLQEIGAAGLYMAAFQFDDDTTIRIEGYGSTGKKVSTVKGKVELTEEAKAKKYIFRTSHFLSVLGNLVLRNLEDENGKIVGKEKVVVYISDKAFTFKNVKKGTVLGIGIVSPEIADRQLRATQAKKDAKAPKKDAASATKGTEATDKEAETVKEENVNKDE